VKPGKKRRAGAQAEDFLEAILRLGRDGRTARVRDLADELGLHKSTVSLALKGLAERGLVEHDRYDSCRLTPKGEAIAAEVDRSHEAIQDFLSTVLGIRESEAASNACRMEHVVDRRVLGRIGDFVRFARERPDMFKPLFEAFSEFPAGPAAGDVGKA